MIITKIGVKSRKTMIAINIADFLKLIFITVFDKDESIVVFVVFVVFAILIYYILIYNFIKLLIYKIIVCF
jgi:hypothetical protein